MPAGKAFFDTNVLLYLATEEQDKAAKAEALLETGGVVSVQVLNEFASVSLRKMRRSWPVIHDMMTIIRESCEVLPLNPEIQSKGFAIAERYGFSVYDSMIVAAAIASGCETIYSENLQDGQIIGHTRVANPF